MRFSKKGYYSEILETLLIFHRFSENEDRTLTTKRMNKMMQAIAVIAPNGKF